MGDDMDDSPNTPPVVDKVADNLSNHLKSASPLRLRAPPLPEDESVQITVYHPQTEIEVQFSEREMRSMDASEDMVRYNEDVALKWSGKPLSSLASLILPTAKTSKAAEFVSALLDLQSYNEDGVVWERDEENGNKLTIDGTCMRGYETYEYTDADVHSAMQQRANTLDIPKAAIKAINKKCDKLRERFDIGQVPPSSARDFIIGFDHLIREMKKTTPGEMLGAHLVNSANANASFGWHNDAHSKEYFETTVSIQLSEGDATIKIAGDGEKKYGGPGGIVAFKSWSLHRTGVVKAVANKPMWKLVGFFALPKPSAKTGAATTSEEAVSDAGRQEVDSTSTVARNRHTSSERPTTPMRLDSASLSGAPAEPSVGEGTGGDVSEQVEIEQGEIEQDTDAASGGSDGGCGDDVRDQTADVDGSGGGDCGRDVSDQDTDAGSEQDTDAGGGGGDGGHVSEQDADAGSKDGEDGADGGRDVLSEQDADGGDDADGDDEGHVSEQDSNLQIEYAGSGHQDDDADTRMRKKNMKIQKQLQISFNEKHRKLAPPKPLPTTSPAIHSQTTDEIPEHYDLEHPYWELDSEDPIKAVKAIGKTIKKNMLYVVYKNKQTGDVKEVELGLTLKQIRLRLNGYKQAEKRKAQRLEDCVKKGQKKLSHAMHGLRALDDDHKEIEDKFLSSMKQVQKQVQEITATAIKEVQALKKKAKSHASQASGHIQGAMDALAEGMA